eukprot:753529-Hanusia_phi.AAC.1
MLSRSERVRIDKAEQRRRTRALVLQLDALVPLQSRPLSAEKGSLASRRTIMQLHEDTLAAVKSLRRGLDGQTKSLPKQEEGSASKDSSGSEEERARSSPELPAGASHNGPVTLVKVESGAHQDDTDKRSADVVAGETKVAGISMGAVMEGMLESEMLLLMEVDMTDWTVTRLSKGLQKWFSCLPAPGLVGHSLLRCVPSPDLPTLRELLIKEPPARLREFSARLLTFGSEAFECLKCNFAPTQSVSTGMAVFFVSFPQACPSPVSKFPSKGLAAMLRDLCGVFEYDEKISHPFPWVVDKEFKQRHEHMQSDQTEFGWCQRCVNALLKIEVGREILEKIKRLQGKQQDTSEEFVLREVNRMTQFHMMFDVNQSDTPVIIVHTRLKLPQEAGAFTTPWSEMYRATLDGVPVKNFLSDTGSYLRIYGHRNAAEGILHMTAFHEIPTKDGWDWFHR